MRRFTLLALAVGLLALPASLRAQAVDVDVIILVDTSGSLTDDLGQLCAALPGALESIRESGLSVQARVVGVKDKYRCIETTVFAMAGGSDVADDDWGIGIAELAGSSLWRPSALRVIIPVSDAGPAGGNPVDDPGPDRDVTTRAIRAAVANKVILSPLLATPDSNASPDDRARLEALAQDMAAKTGGRVFVSAGLSDVPQAVEQLILAAVETKAGLTAIAAAIPTPANVSLDPGILLTNAALAGLAVTVLGLTTTLFDEAFGTRRTLPSNRVANAIAAAAGRIRTALGRLATPTGWQIGNTRIRRAATIVILAAFLALTALVASFLDPNFQPGAAVGAGTFATLLVALALVNLAAALGGNLAARSRQVAPGLRVRPGAVLLVAACVVVSRSIGFLPGYLIGLPAGLALLMAEANRERDLAIGRAAVLAAIATGLAAWLLSWPVELLSARLSGSPGSGIATLGLGVTGGVQSTLLAIFLIAFEFALFDLLPIGSTTGRLWLAQKRLVWGVAFGVVVFAALHTLFNPNRAGLDALRNASLLPLGAIIAAYSGVTLIAWLLTNEARIRDPQNLNRRSALTAGVLIVAWLGGIACVALAEVAGAANPGVVLLGVMIAVVVAVGAWLVARARARWRVHPQEKP
jgi:hypothetical protein